MPLDKREIFARNEAPGQVYCIMRVDEGSTSTTEATPLIRSETSSAAPPSDGTRPSSEIYRDDETADGDGAMRDEPNQKVGPGRGLAIVLSVYVLIFLQGRLPM